MPEDEMDPGDLIGAIWMIIGLITLVGGILMQTFWTEIAAIVDTYGVLAMVTSVDSAMLMFLAVIIGLLEFIGGLFTWLRLEIGRVIVSILAIPSVIAIPIGTIISILTWYVLLWNEPTKNEFKKVDFDANL